MNGATRLTVGLALCLAGCTFDTSGVDPVSLAVDAADGTSSELSRVVDVSEAGTDLLVDEPDGLVADAPVPDHGAPDQTPVDQVVPDQPKPDTARPPCATTYGSVSGYKLCQETATECTFFFTSGSCDSKCQANGGTCIKAAADSNNSCNELYSTSCSTVHGDGLCTCTR